MFAEKCCYLFSNRGKIEGNNRNEGSPFDEIRCFTQNDKRLHLAGAYRTWVSRPPRLQKAVKLAF
jgi:hypothetical protein